MARGKHRGLRLKLLELSLHSFYDNRAIALELTGTYPVFFKILEKDFVMFFSVLLRNLSKFPSCRTSRPRIKKEKRFVQEKIYLLLICRGLALAGMFFLGPQSPAPAPLHIFVCAIFVSAKTERVPLVRFNYPLSTYPCNYEKSFVGKRCEIFFFF